VVILAQAACLLGMLLFFKLGFGLV